MAVIPSLRLRWMRFTGALPSASKIEAQRRTLRGQYERFQAYRSSDEYARYKSLRNQVESGDTTNEKEYKALSRSRALKQFRQQEERGVFDELERRDELFFDDFDGVSLDKGRWLTRFFWGDALLKRPYSISTDPHCYTDGQNVRVEDGRLVIETRSEQKESLCWDAKLGLMNKLYYYTSGVVCTGSSFRMPYGRVEAKVRFRSQPGVYHALYLVGNKMYPQIDVFRTDPNDNRIIRGAFNEGVPQRNGGVEVRRTEEEMGRLPFGSEYFILSVEWQPGKMVWSINGMPYMERKVTLSGEPMYLVFASGVEQGMSPEGVSTLEVAWVRCLSPLR